ncbi:cation transporter [Arcanobacterium haemolyticum]|nr:cation transporter [Arcanobacterium haemolyticum]
MAHTHDHSGAHRTRLVIVFATTSSVFVAEVVGALLTGSLALLVDAAHMLTDTCGLALALWAATLMTKPREGRRTWGYRRAEVMSAAAQALILLCVGIYAVIEGIDRIAHPASIPPRSLLIFGIIGLIANLVGLLVLVGGRHSNLNLRAAFLEVANDALGSIGVIVSAVVISLTGWTSIDAIIGLVIAAMILPRAIVILRRAIRVLMEESPDGLDVDELRAHILSAPHVRGVHDLHVSEVGTGLPVLTAHVEMDPECFTQGDISQHLDELRQCVSAHFPVKIEHSTFQLEPANYSDSEHLPHE